MKDDPIPKNGRDFLETYWQGIDTNLPKPIILTVDQLVVILDNYGRRISTQPAPISEESDHILYTEFWAGFLINLPEDQAWSYGKQIAKTIKQALSQGNPTLIKKLWTLWDSLAEAGELSAGKDFIANYNELKKEV